MCAYSFPGQKAKYQVTHIHTYIHIYVQHSYIHRSTYLVETSASVKFPQVLARRSTNSRLCLVSSTPHRPCMPTTIITTSAPCSPEYSFSGHGRSPRVRDVVAQAVSRGTQDVSGMGTPSHRKTNNLLQLGRRAYTQAPRRKTSEHVASRHRYAATAETTSRTRRPCIYKSHKKQKKKTRQDQAKRFLSAWNQARNSQQQKRRRGGEGKKKPQVFFRIRHRRLPIKLPRSMHTCGTTHAPYS